jgi:hypothetical protein
MSCPGGIGWGNEVELLIFCALSALLVPVLPIVYIQKKSLSTHLVLLISCVDPPYKRGVSCKQFFLASDYHEPR